MKKTKILSLCLAVSMIFSQCRYYAAIGPTFNATVHEQETVNEDKLYLSIEPVAREEVSSVDTIDISTQEEIVEEQVQEEIEIVEEPIIEEPAISDWEIDLISLVTMAEAEDEPELGQRLVIDTILNRVDSERFPNSIYDVIYQPHQFSSMWNGRVDRCYVMDDIRQLVMEELQYRQNYECLFFTADDYGAYGEHMFPVGNHYFAK